MEILKRMIKKQEEEAKRAKQRVTELKHLLKMLKENAELETKIKEWALYDYMRSGQVPYGSKEDDMYTKLVKERINEISEIEEFGVMGKLSGAVWDLEHEIKRQLELKNKQAAK